MIRLTRRQFKRTSRKADQSMAGGRILDSGDAMKTERFGSLVRVTQEAPHGFVWSASGVHELVAEARGGREATQAAQRDIRERAALGIERCTDSDCDWCQS